MLLDEFRAYDGVKLCHMACRANEAQDEIVFLYKFQPGKCPQSFGLNVAMTAGIPKIVLDRARVKATEFSEVLNDLTGKAKDQRRHKLEIDVC